VTINFWFLIPTLILLWLPRQWLRIGRIRPKKKSRTQRHRSAPADEIGVVPEFQNHSVQFGKEMRNRRNWLDLFRSIAGSICLTEYCFGAGPNPPPTLAEQILGAQAGILVIAMLFQLFRLKRQSVLFAPIFFLLGLTVGLVGYESAFFAWIMIWAVNVVLPGPASFLFTYAAVVGGFGAVFVGKSKLMMLMCGLSCFPLLVSVMARRRLMHFTKKEKTPSDYFE
jgi:hypothetical protein